MNLRNRLDRLERRPGLGEPPWEPPSPVDLEGRLEQWVGLPPGSISRTAHEARERGYSCVAEHVASVLGMSLTEFRAALEARAHNFRER